jgi:hypothetical protein
MIKQKHLEICNSVAQIWPRLYSSCGSFFLYGVVGVILVYDGLVFFMVFLQVFASSMFSFTLYFQQLLSKVTHVYAQKAV